jgi:hypothetical protein
MQHQRLNLNGEWQLSPGGEERPTAWLHGVPVPALVDVATPPISDWRDFDYFWYKKEFQLPSAAKFQHLYLQLEQVQFGTEVWLNGQLIGGDIPCYTSQWFDLTPRLQKSAANVLFVRVGAKHTLPAHSAVGNDFEKLSWIPGIWGDVWLHLYGSGRVSWTQILPNIHTGSIRVRSEIENFSTEEKTFQLFFRVLEKSSGRLAAHPQPLKITAAGNSVATLETEIPIPDFQLWSPETPFLYVLEVILSDTDPLRGKEEDRITHQTTVPFGMREFEIHAGHFYLNGHRRVLMGSNIAFHRLLCDPMRGTRPWQGDWIKKALVDIPKAHNLTLFRMHLGHAYNRWYDLADEHGILLQDEWAFWTSTGTPEQIEREFRAWIRENCNHPSIVIWDALNESTDATITEEIIPRLKELDPTRPWELVDFSEDHPYIYSLGPVLNDKKFGFARSIFDLAKSSTPTMVNEFEWWWLDHEGNPTPLTEVVVARWLGRHPTKEQLLQHQAFLASELAELWRRLNLDAILPFVYLSAGGGPTANWFLGPLEELRPKPVLAAYKNAFSPVGVSLELWDRHFQTAEKRPVNIFLFNDTLRETIVQLRLANQSDSKNYFYEKAVRLAANEHRVIPLEWALPEHAGEFRLRAELTDLNGQLIAFSEKPAFVFAEFSLPESSRIPKLALHDPSGELRQYLQKKQVAFRTDLEDLNDAQVVLLNQPSNGFKPSERLTDFVARGGVLILQEPEFGVTNDKQLRVLPDLELDIQYREDADKGGYDSHVFPKDPTHFLWQGLHSKHLQMFNGALGGEIVSQHSVRPNVPFNPLASCSLCLKVPAVMEIPYGKGWVVVSRIQIRGRLLHPSTPLRMNTDSLHGERSRIMKEPKAEPPDMSSRDLYARRYDPVAERYFWNLVTGYVNQETYQIKIQQKLAEQKIYLWRVRTSTGDVYDPMDRKIDTRCCSVSAPPQWVWIDFGQVTVLKKITLRWETPHYKQFQLHHALDDQKWQPFHHGHNADGRKVEIPVNRLQTKYLRIDFMNRERKFGNALWEMEFE